MKKTIQLVLKYTAYQAVLLAVLLLFISSAVFAQSDTGKKLKEVTVKSLLIQKIPLTVPSQTITAADFVRYNAINVSGVIQDFAGVAIKDYGGIGGLKTISVRGLGANHTATLFDGVQINDAENGQVDLSKLNLNGIKSITLYNGQPPNILQTARAFASASILSIETAKPKFDTIKLYLITVGVNAGSSGLINPSLQWQQRLSKNWAFILNGYTENANGRYKYINDEGAGDVVLTRMGSEIAAQQVDGALYWKKTDSSKFNLHIYYYNSDRGLPGPVILYKKQQPGQHLWSQDLFIQAGYEHIWDSGFHILINSKFSHNFLHYNDSYFPSSSGILDRHYTQREFYQSAALSYAILPNWEVSYATDVAVNNMDADLPNFSHPTRVTLLNVLATNLILGNVTLQASLLNTKTNESVKTGNTIPSYNILSPTLIATIKPLQDKDFQVRAFYKSIFRNPTFNDLYYEYVPNVNLKPEFTHQFDLGTTYNKALTGLLDYVTFTADAYYNNIDNKIVYTPGLYNGSSQNFGKVDIKGIDAAIKTQAKWGATNRATLGLTYSYQQALDVTGPVTASTYLNQLPYIPKNTFAFDAGISKGAVGVYYNQIYSSLRYYNGNNDVDHLLSPYLIGNASIVYTGKLNNSRMVLSAGVNNLFDKRYEIVKSYPMPGRSYLFSLQITI